MFVGVLTESANRRRIMPKCSVEDCGKDADCEVILYDIYSEGTVYFERDYTCPYLCTEHVVENEKQARGDRRPRGCVQYPHSNKHGAQGFTIYKPLAAALEPAS
jgi:hypothetical protein